MSEKLRVLLLTDGDAGSIGTDLDILYPEQVTRMDFTSEAHGTDQLGQYTHVITMVRSGDKLDKLDYDAVTAYAEGGGRVISCLFEYARSRRLHFSKTHVMDRLRPGMRIEVENDVTRGYAAGDTVWWYGTVSSAPDQLYANQMLQRQVVGVQESPNLSVLATSTVNSGAVMIEEKIGTGHILALDLLSLNRPFYNSWGSTNKYLFIGNFINGAVRYGKHYPKRLSCDAFVEAMGELAARHPALSLQAEGACSDGRQMWSLNIGDEANPTIYLGAAIHGWEWENAFGLLRLAEILCETPHVEGLDTRRLHFKIVPIQNPWGYDHFTRHNARGVDLNRNFDCAWEQLESVQDVIVPWDYNYKGTRPASEPETRVIQGIFDRHCPLCVSDFHTADYIMLRAHKGDATLLDEIHQDIKERLKDRYLCQKPYHGDYQQVHMERSEGQPVVPYCISYAAEKGTAAAFLIEMSGNRDDVHGLVMNTDAVVEICLAAVRRCLLKR